MDDQAISDHVKDQPQHYSPENSLTPLSPTVTYSPGLDESHQPVSDGGKLDEISCKENGCIAVMKLSLLLTVAILQLTVALNNKKEMSSNDSLH